MLSRSLFRLHHIALGVQWAMAIYAFIMSRPEAAKAGGIIRRELLGSAGMLSRSLFRLHHIALGVQRAMAIYTFIMSRPEAAKAGGVICGEFFRSAGMLTRSRFPFYYISLGIAGLVALAALVPTALITAVAGGVVSLVPFCAGGVLSDSAFITGTYKHFRVSHCIAAPAAILTYVMFYNIPAIGAVPVGRIQGGSRSVNSRSSGIGGCAAIGFTGSLTDGADVIR